MVLRAVPAEVTVDTGSLLREPKKDMRKGTRAIWLMALRALLDVSLVFHRLWNASQV